MNNRFSDELISAYLDGELTAAEQALVEQTLVEDAAVRQMFEELRSLRAGLQSLPQHHLDDDFSQRVLRTAERTMLKGPASTVTSTTTTSTTTSAPDVATRLRQWRRGFWLMSTVAAALMVILTVNLVTPDTRGLARGGAVATGPEVTFAPPKAMPQKANGAYYFGLGKQPAPEEGERIQSGTFSAETQPPAPLENTADRAAGVSAGLSGGFGGGGGGRGSRPIDSPKFKGVAADSENDKKLNAPHPDLNVAASKSHSEVIRKLLPHNLADQDAAAALAAEAAQLPGQSDSREPESVSQKEEKPSRDKGLAEFSYRESLALPNVALPTDPDDLAARVRPLEPLDDQLSAVAQVVRPPLAILELNLGAEPQIDEQLKEALAVQNIDTRSLELAQEIRLKRRSESLDEPVVDRGQDEFLLIEATRGQVVSAIESFAKQQADWADRPLSDDDRLTKAVMNKLRFNEQLWRRVSERRSEQLQTDENSDSQRAGKNYELNSKDEARSKGEEPEKELKVVKNGAAETRRPTRAISPKADVGLQRETGSEEQRGMRFGPEKAPGTPQELFGNVRLLDSLSLELRKSRESVLAMKAEKKKRDRADESGVRLRGGARLSADDDASEIVQLLLIIRRSEPVISAARDADPPKATTDP